MSGIGVTTAIIVKTKKESLHHLGDLIIPLGISTVTEAEEESMRGP